MSESHDGIPVAPPRRGTVFIGRWFGIAFYLDFSWFLIAGLVTYILATQLFPVQVPFHSPTTYTVTAVCAALLFFLSILLHELGHSIVSQRCGIAVPRITLLFIGGVAEIAREPDDPKSELKIALGGPAVTVILIGLYAGAAYLFHLPGWRLPQTVCEWLAASNLALLVFNMVPGFPLDGGRVLRAIIWARSGRLRRATFITSRLAIGFAWLLVALGAWLVLEGHWNGLVLFIIALFLRNAARQGYDSAVQREALGKLRVRALMTPDPVCIPRDFPLDRVPEEFFLARRLMAFPVCEESGRFLGLLRLEDILEIERARRKSMRSEEALPKENSAYSVISADAEATRAIRIFQVTGAEELAVLDSGRLVGMITRSDVRRHILIRTALDD